MQFGPHQHEPELANTEAALDGLDPIDLDLRLRAGVTSVEMRRLVIVVDTAVTIPKKRQFRRHDARWCRRGRSSLAASVASATWTTDLPPVGLRLALLAFPLKRQRCALPCAATGTTERPELLGRSLVVMNQLIQVERVDLAGVHLRKAIADVVEEETQLLFVILANHLTRRPAARLVVLDISDPDTFGHRRNLPRAPARAHHTGRHSRRS